MASEIFNPQSTNRSFAGSAKFLSRAILIVAAIISVSPMSGCSQPVLGRLGIVDEIAISYRDVVWAKRAFNLRYANCNLPYPQHFECGFCAGYSDVCNGGDGFVPALPPSEYRGYEFQSTDGQQCVKSWFKGYPEGVAAARADNADKFHDLYTSRLIDKAVTQENTKTALKGDKKIRQTTQISPNSPTAPPQRSAAAPKKPLSSVYRPTPTPAQTPQAQTAAVPPIVNGNATQPQAARPLKFPTPATPNLPPIISSNATYLSAPAGNMQAPVIPALPPIVSVDPTTNVRQNEVSQPLSARSASWESRRRQVR